MGRLGNEIKLLVARLAGDEASARKHIRGQQVRDRYSAVLRTVYKDNANLFLAHTNNVYIMDKKGVRTLIVYVDEAIFAAELNAQRELIKLKLLELFGEQAEEFEIYISRGAYRNHYPYLEAMTKEEPPAKAMPLDEEEKRFVEETARTVEDVRVRKSLEKAMRADLQWKKGD